MSNNALPGNAMPEVYESPRPASGLSMDTFDYDLPEERIAQHPIEPRDAARLFVSLDESDERHLHVRDLASMIGPHDVIVVNETRVIPARLLLQKDTGGAVEVLLVDLVDDGGIEVGGIEAGTQPSTRRWHALVKPSKKVASGSMLRASNDLVVVVGDRVDGGQRLVELRDPATGQTLDAEAEERALLGVGRAPLPPYITAPLVDEGRYQTTFARIPGSAAAPTAGLHLTQELLERCVDAGASLHRVELCVGLDTFRPVSVERPEDHEIHSERFRVPDQTLQACLEAKARGGRVIAVGTTSVRALESAVASGLERGRTKLFIYGEYEFRLVDVLLTNFHLPRSSLLLLIDAFVGPRWRSIYERAVAENYRFLSFGDAMLLGGRERSRV